MYTNFLSSLPAVIFSHVFASSLILIFVALYQADCYAALRFVHLLLESYFPTFKQVCYFVHARFKYRVYFCDSVYVILCFRFTSLSVQPLSRKLRHGSLFNSSKTEGGGLNS